MIRNTYSVHTDGYIIVYLNDGYKTYIDSIDLPILYDRKWYLNDINNMQVIYSDTVTTLSMHRLVMSRMQSIPEGVIVSHPNGDPLDNRRCNLSILDRSVVRHGDKIRKDNKSGVKGVYYNTARERWIARITRNKKTKEQSFLTKEAAIVWRKQEEMNGIYSFIRYIE
jgi:hypothetical protein